MSRLEQIREKYLGQSIREFVNEGGRPTQYAKLVFSGEIFGPGEDPTDAELGIESEGDLVEALELLVSEEVARSLGRFTHTRPGAISRSHNVNMSPGAHAQFADLSPVERGDLIEAALRDRE